MKNLLLLTLVSACMMFATLSNNFAQDDTQSETSMLKKHVEFLASDELEGRLPGEPGNFKAAEYILNQFKQIGLAPLNGNFKQEFPFITGTGLAGNNETYVNTIVKRPGVPESMWKSVKRNWELGNDWQPMRFSKNGTVEGKLVFAGHGVSAKELNYDDYANIDVKGKIVIVLTDSSEDVAQWQFLSEYRSLRYKTENAAKHGAAGIILVKKQSDSANVWYRMTPEAVKWNNDIVVIQANRLSIAKFFPREQALYPLEKEITEKKQPKTFELEDITISITVNLEQAEKQIPNIMGMVPGTNPKKSNEYLVVGAHFDHIGWGKDSSRFKSPYWAPGYKIHNGADDNASGTAALIELARTIKNSPLENPVIFVAFNAKEFGTVGSSFFVKNPPVPSNNMVFILNLDMVGRMGGGRLNALGAASSAMIDTLIDVVSESNVKIHKIGREEVRGDHYNFYDANIPFVLLTTGTHNDFHRPTDTAEKIQYGSLTRITNFSEKLLRSVSLQSAKPDFRKINLQSEE